MTDAPPRPARRDCLPRSLPPRGVRREAAAQYIGVSATKFDELVRDGRMPGATLIDGCKIWDVRALDRAFDALTESAVTNPWDDALVS